MVVRLVDHALEAEEPRSQKTPLGISVIVPTYNGADTIADLLDALAGTTDQVWELVVVDDASTDATVDVVQAFAARLKQTRIVMLPSNEGKAAALNRGIRLARFDKLVFLDDDDRPAPGYLRALDDALERCEFVCSVIRLDELNAPHMVDALFQSGLNYLTVPFRAQGPRESDLTHVPVSMGGTLAVRRRTIERVGGFNPEARVCDDMDLCFRLWRLGIVLETEPAAILDYRLRTGSRALFCQRIQYGRGWAWLYDTYRLNGIVRPTRWMTLMRIGRAQLRFLSTSRRSAYNAAIAEAGFAVGLTMGPRRS
jgi:GT2 family glycosyltransferase